MNEDKNSTSRASTTKTPRKSTEASRSEIAQRREKRQKKRRKKIYLGTTILLVAFLAVLDLFNIFSRDKTFSENENRILAQRPAFSMSSLASGKYMTEMEDYITDQFVFRDKWIQVKYTADRLLGKKESNGVYIGKKGYLMEKPDEPDMEKVQRTTDAIRSFADSHASLNMVMTLVPNAVTVCDQYLPGGVPVRNQVNDIEFVQYQVDGLVDFRDITDVMRGHKDEPIYYRTDHHWTSRGAKYAFDAIKDALVLDGSVEFEAYPVTEHFSGTLASKVGYHKVDDVIEIYLPKVDAEADYLVDYVGEEKTTSIYKSEALNQKDKYEVFFGGNHARIDIKTQVTGKKLLVFKDSYANAFIQFLLPYYESITIVDPRYYYDDIDQLIATNRITDVLFLYNVNTFMGDTSLADVLAG